MTEPLFRIHVVAERVGVSEPVLRVWERRYKLLTPKRTPSGYRAYTESDIALLQRVTALIKEGMAIGEVAQMLPALRRDLKHKGEQEPTPPSETPTAVHNSRIEEWVSRGLDAARRDDQRSIERLLDEALAVLPPIQALEAVLLPLQRAVGDAWHQRTLSTSQEHLVSHAVRARVLALLHSAPGQAHRHVVCACLPDEDHDIGLLGAALRFRHAGFQVTYLGARTPIKELADTVQTIKPDLVALGLVKSISPVAFGKTLEELTSAIGNGPRLVIGGAGAEKHAALAREHGVWLISSADDWDRVLNPTPMPSKRKGQ